MIKINGKEIEFERLPNGETKIPVDLDIPKNAEFSFFYETDEDLIKLFLFQSACQLDTLAIRYMPYSRQDRQTGGGAFTLKYIANLINSLLFETIYIDEPHSDVTMALIDNSIVGETALDLLDQVIEETGFDIENDYIFFPDAGAHKRYGSEISLKTLIGIKTRDRETHQPDKMEIVGKKESGSKVIILDDLCSYGRTFALAANHLSKMLFDEIYLCVYHLEPSVYRGPLLQGGIVDGIWASDSLMQHSDHPLIHIIGE